MGATSGSPFNASGSSTVVVMLSLQGSSLLLVTSSPDTSVSLDSTVSTFGVAGVSPVEASPCGVVIVSSDVVVVVPSEGVVVLVSSLAVDVLLVVVSVVLLESSIAIVNHSPEKKTNKYTFDVIYLKYHIFGLIFY